MTKGFFKITSIVSLIVLSALVGMSFSKPVEALPRNLDTSLFNPGFIIDDTTFTNYQTMTVEEIQTFLEENVTNQECRRYRNNPRTGQTEGPFTCLFEFEQNIETNKNNFGEFEDDGSPTNIEGGKTAAQIIYDSAQKHKINPQVLLVLLQKEQSLITDNWPYLRQFAKATGYACPDFQACDPTLADFFHQVDRAAWQFRRYIENLDRYWYVIGENRVLYHPNAACGSKVVNFKNRSTIALYLYTPFVPNQAALNNFYGVGDNCSSYGNRNFWSYFNYWFGSSTSGPNVFLEEEEAEEEEEEETVVVSEDWKFEVKSTNTYRSSSKETWINMNSDMLKPNQAVYVVLEITNLSPSTPWHKEADHAQRVVLAPFNDEEYRSQICNLETEKPLCPAEITYSEDGEIAGGQTATFEFYIIMPNGNSFLNQNFMLKHSEDFLNGYPINISFLVDTTAEPVTNNVTFGATTQPVPPTDDEEEEVNEEEEEEETEEETPPTNTPTPPAPTTTSTVTLPDNWASLSVIEKVRLNPYKCLDTTKIRADNGRCLSGGSALDQTPPANTPATTPPTEEETPTTNTPSTTPSTSSPTINTVVLPDNWAQLSVIEKVRLNPYKCLDTTKIRADNGRCLSGGSALTEDSTTQPTPQADEETEEETPSTNTPSTSGSSSLLPDNWASLSVIEKIRLNPYKCLDTTKIRADNGRCLSGGSALTDPEEAVPVEET